MEIRSVIILFIGLAISCSNRTETNKESKKGDTSIFQEVDPSGMVVPYEKKDTLTIVNSDLTNDPFDLGDSPLNTLTSVKNAITTYETYENRHIKNQIDTIFRITIQKDTFTVYKAKSDSWLMKASIFSTNFPISHGINVGMTNSEVQHHLNRAETLPGVVRLKNAVVSEWIDLKFRNSKVFSIDFKGFRKISK